MYCDFLSFPNQTEATKSQYLETLGLEAEVVAKALELKGDFRIDTLFLGGGTPSLIAADEMKRLLDKIRVWFCLDDECEITVESNPGSLTLENLKGYKKAGVNRISLGVQSFDDGILRQLGRIHQGKTAVDSVGLIRQAGFDNLSLDLMFGLPGQTMKVWLDTLDSAISLKPEHLSIYSLQLEEGTPFYEDYRLERLPMLDQNLDRRQYHEAINKLKSEGYEPYEISNFARSGSICQHNLKYWSMDEYFGLGLGASSYFDRQRWRNLQDLATWQGQIQKGTLPRESQTFFTDTTKDEMGIYLFTGLRKTKGISRHDFFKRYGQDVFQAYQADWALLLQYQQQGLVDWTHGVEGRLYLTEKGIDYSNEIMAIFV